MLLTHCRTVSAHGPDGKRDLWGYLPMGVTLTSLSTGSLAAGQTSEFNHGTDGYRLTNWPSGPFRATPGQYYRWLERAGLADFVWWSTCCRQSSDLRSRSRYPRKSSINADMVSVEQTRDLCDGTVHRCSSWRRRKGFRVVTSPEEARAVIGAGKMAVVRDRNSVCSIVTQVNVPAIMRC